MDFHTLSRKELQALSKMNKIPANITNVAMADALSALPHVNLSPFLAFFLFQFEIIEISLCCILISLCNLFVLFRFRFNFSIFMI